MAVTFTERPVEVLDTPRPRHALRGDVQGLRALAVGVVLLYHLRPSWLPGGFVGVDVFFVISGFLIIGTLTTELRRSGTISLRDFYARRIRRLLPAATATLLAVVAAVVLLLPQSRWPGFLREVVAAALNAQNWLLAVLSNDYGHATAGASPVQHYWSLAVEEQFYLVIPLLLIASAALAGRLNGRTVPYAVGAVALVTVASFAFSVYYTPVDHGAAYFVTPTRMWELGIGGLTAMVLHRVTLTRAVREVLGWLGFGAVLAATALYTTDMEFPGWVAALPVLGTAAMLACAGTALARLLSVRPVRYVGDISYSLYLWHWPVIVVILELSGEDRLSKKEMLVAAVISFGLAALSKRFVEDPFRRDRVGRRGTYLLGAVLVVVSVVAASVPWYTAQEQRTRLLSRMGLDADHPGAMALAPRSPRPAPTGVPLLPDPAVANEDGPYGTSPDGSDCHVYRLDYPETACWWGDEAALKTVVLLGDSHAAQYSTPLIDFARGAGKGLWKVRAMTRNGCPFNAVPPAEAGTPLTVCSDQNRVVLDRVRDLKPDLVVLSGMSRESYVSDLKWTWQSREDMVRGYREMLTAFSAAGIPVAVIKDLPRPNSQVPRCLERNADDPAACGTPQAEAFRGEGDPLVAAAEGVSGVEVVDLTSWYCRDDVCPAVVGNVVVYRNNHVTNTYVRTLATPLLTGLGLI
ncbi:Peptidoglycan/LPS O-acetylase OafA/YrhL, contains acyltransferase and SGNH-hydrolase domains [Lentzea xinjiangensis]|uniref:Peptidoglycan/LPS O-acetylase OafA/YrhL, contains acyltransferase and SGNH-hydrolase domains n=1 Tax=Lentzea xinjiangensis TaxID=402600 RepID=A0A1H9U633_9PSEU|nr:acyltransferase family protein [Lentzea xinjiangensis]SES04624.1 Peptidoglycan/LPS O-acetylase OafA/YrhL, contains acyltransferase and SGNH-hydrolase domains [Lentzea xinjiangensis]